MQGHIRKRTHATTSGKTTVNWYVVIDLPRDTDGKRRQKWHGGYRTRREAEAVRAKIVHDLNTGTYIEPSAITLTGWVRELWLPTVKSRVKPSTFDSYSRNLDLHILHRLGARQLRQITPSMLNRLYADLLADGNRKVSGGLSAKTVRYIHTILHKALADAVDAGLIAINPAGRAKPPRPRARLATEIAFWEPAELREFLKFVHGHRLEAAWHVAAMTGMRRGEVLGLRWKDVDFDAARISVRQALVSVAYEVIVSTPKNHHARMIDLDEGTVHQLRAHQQRQQADRKEWGSDYQDQGLVFCKVDGTPIHPHTFSQTFERLVAKTTLPTIRLHDLRVRHEALCDRVG
jgi:integrase